MGARATHIVLEGMGSDGAAACLGMGDDQIGAKNTESDGPTPQGERTLHPSM